MRRTCRRCSTFYALGLVATLATLAGCADCGGGLRVTDPDSGVVADGHLVDVGLTDSAGSDTLGRDALLVDSALADRALGDRVTTDSARPDSAVADVASADRAQVDALALDAASGDAGADPWPLDPDVAPLSVGSWYRPGVSSTWQWQLSGTLNTSYDVAIYDVDLFETGASTISTLHGQGRHVLCYFSAGSSENWRPDFAEFDAADLGNNLDGWPGERWLDVRSRNVFDIMLARLDLAASKGCDGVEPDNVDGYDGNRTGFPLTARDQLAYNRNLANAAHRRGLAVALKNDVGQISALVAYYDLSVNEECHDYGECGDLQPFIDAGKPVLNAEYADTLNQAQSRATTLCPIALGENLRTLILPWDLDDGFRVACD